MPRIIPSAISGSAESGWVKQFSAFMDQTRIVSKHLRNDEDGVGSKWNLWTSQLRFLQEICAGLDEGVRRFYVLKSRQLGISTISMALDLFWLAMHDGIKSALVCDTPKNQSEFRKILETYHKSLNPDFVGESFRLVKSNDKYIEFSNGSVLTYLIAGKQRGNNSWGDGKAFTAAHLTELSLYGSKEGLDSFMETFSDEHPDRLYIFESRANGMNHWYDMWNSAGDDPLTTKRIFIGWWANDLNRIKRTDPRFENLSLERKELSADEADLINKVNVQYQYDVSEEQLAWYRHRRSDSSVDEATLDSNQPWIEQQAFVASGAGWFLPGDITHCIQDIRENNYFFKGFRYHFGHRFQDVRLEELNPDIHDRSDADLKIWQEPVDGAFYTMGVDSAGNHTDHGDRHAISVFRCFADKIVQVAQWATNKCDTHEAAWVAFHLAAAYKDCIVNIELGGGYGDVIMIEHKRLKGMLQQDATDHYPNESWRDFQANVRWYLYHRIDSMGGGFAYNSKSGHNATVARMTMMKAALRTRSLLVRCLDLCDEMLMVEQDSGGHIGAPDSRSEFCKDDRVFAAALAIETWEMMVRGRLIAENYLYEQTMAVELGKITGAENLINMRVQSWLKAFDRETYEDPSRQSSWMERMGLT